MNFEDLSTEDLMKSLEAEIAKALAEIKCSQGDLDKANARLRFSLAVLHTIKDRKE